jgi:hypothetical protein
LIICDTYRVNKLIEAKLGLVHLSERSRVGKPIRICNGTNNGTWWLRRVQRIRRRIKNRCGLSRQPIDLMNKLNAIIEKIITGPIIMVVLNWFSKSHGNFKFKYDVIDTNWVGVDLLYLLSL